MGLLSLFLGAEATSIEGYCCWALVPKCAEGPDTFYSAVMEEQGDEGTDHRLHSPGSWGCLVAFCPSPVSWGVRSCFRSPCPCLQMIFLDFLFFIVFCFCSVLQCSPVSLHLFLLLNTFPLSGYTTVYVYVHFIVDGHLVISGFMLLRRIASNVVNVS